MTIQASDITNMDVKFMTYNMDKRSNMAIILKLLQTHEPDVLALQEVNSYLLDKDSRDHRLLHSYLEKYKYKFHMSNCNLTLIKQDTLGPYLAQSQANADGRILISPLQITTGYTIYIINTYGCQRGNPNYIPINTCLINYLDAFYEDKEQTNYHVIPIGDMNIDLNRDYRVPVNILQYFHDKFRAFSVLDYFHKLVQEESDETISSPITYKDNDNGESCIDHICLPQALLTATTDETDPFAPKIIIRNDNPSPHRIVSQRAFLPLQDVSHILNTDPLPPLYRKLASIPLMPGPDPTQSDPENEDWFQPDDTMIRASKLDAKVALIQEAHKIQTTDTMLQLLQQEANQNINALTQTLIAHYRTTEELPARTKATQELISKAYAAIENGIQRTMTRLNLDHDPPDMQKQQIPPLTLRIQTKLDTFRATLALVYNKSRTTDTHQRKKQMQRLSRQADSILNIITKMETSIANVNKDYSELILLRQQRKAAREDEKKSKSKQKDSKQKKNTIKKLRPICSLDNAATLQTQEDIFLNHHEKYLNYIRHTKKTVTEMSKRLSKYSKSEHIIDTLKTRSFAKTIKTKYINTLKSRIKYINNQFDNIFIDFHHLFGDSSKPATLIHNKTNPMPAANITIPIYTNPLAAPTHVPAVGPQQQKEATRATQQQQADLPPGKSLHFVDIDTDEVGPCGIIFDPDRTFSRADLKEYHPHAEDFPRRIQEAIIEAHGVFPKITKHLHEKHADNTQSPHVQWPYQARIEQCSITSQDTLVYTNPIESMKQQIKYTPSTARLSGFTLNVLARLHPCWMRALDQLANIILVTRILPPQLKLTGRVLIDKPDPTDKRPISILHAYDSYIDTIVAHALSSAVEKIGVYDDTIAAYRPGHSCADCTLNHLLAVQDTLDRPEEDILLCQIDEDKEKFFDRITTELQMLPFQLMGFPPTGFIEWIAESLHNVTVLTTTPYGPVKTSFYCGVRQGSALSCAIANAVAWLSAAPWTIPLESHPPPPGHTPATLHPYDIKYNNSATLDKHSFCDDSSAYITAKTIQALNDHIDRDIHMSNVISIVTKLSINAKKSHIRIYNLNKDTPVQQFFYISWHHLTKTVRKERIPTDNMGALSDTSIMRQFGTYSNRNGHTNVNHSKHFSKMHAARKSFQNRYLTPDTFTSQYVALVTSTLGFNTLAMSYCLKDAIKDDHITLYKFATKAYKIRLPADTFHNIFLPKTTLGQNFKGSLTIQLAIAMARELFVSLNTPNPAISSLLQTRMRAMLHKITVTSTTSNPMNLLPHAIDQLALLGIFLQPTDFPILNNAISILHQDDSATSEIGYPVPAKKATPSPLTNLLNENNTKYSCTSDLYRSHLLTISNLYHGPRSPYHNQKAFSECLSTPYQINIRTQPEMPPASRQLTIRTAATDLIPQYNHLSHFLELRMDTHRSYSDPSIFLNETPLPTTNFRTRLLFDNQEYPTWEKSPHVSLRQFQSQHRLPLNTSRPHNDIIQRIFHRYSSPLLFASDSALNHQNDITVAASMLMHFDTNLSQHPLTIPPKPILLRNHILAKTYGTSITNNNMGESQALTISLNTCPLRAPAIFLIDSRIVLLQIFLYFQPHSQTIRNHLRKHVHTTSMHHYSELCEALQHHWPDPTTRPTRATYPELVPLSVRQHFAETVQLLSEQVGITSIIDLNQDKIIQPLESDESAPPKEHVGLLIGHHFFLHINSHQLTNYGRLRTKETEEGKIQLQPHPNLTLALANTWADRGASRMAPALSDLLPFFFQQDIPQPPITILQYTLQHKARTINTNLTQYIQDQFTSHTYKLAIAEPKQWFLRFSPFFSDPLGTFQKSNKLQDIAQEKAHSHQRLVLIFDDYRKSIQQACHPNDTMPTAKISTQMLYCPFCEGSTIPATSMHYHLACMHGKISNKRRSLLEPINETLAKLDNLTQYMAQTILPNQHSQRFIPRFSLLLRAAIQNATLIYPLTEEDQREYLSTTVYPPFIETGYPTKPHWTGNPTVHPPMEPTNAHYTHLVGPSSTTPIYPDEHTAVTALLGLLPTNTHLAVEEYIHMITTKYSQTIRLQQTSQQRLQAKPTDLNEVYLHLQSIRPQSDMHRRIIDMLPSKRTEQLSKFCTQLYHRLLAQLQNKAEKLQERIQSVLNTYKDAQISKYKASLPPPELTMPLQKPKQTPSKKRPRIPCQGTWCALKQFAAMPYTMTTTSTNCIHCDTMQQAVKLSTQILAQLIPRPSAMAMISQYTPLAPHQMKLHTMANNTAATPIPLDEIRALICTTIPTTTITQISPSLNFLHPDDAHYDEPDQPLQDLVLQYIAYSSLILTSPSMTHEFPSIRNPYHIHKILTRAKAFCMCTKSDPIEHNDADICQRCSSLIPKNIRPLSASNISYTTCITCDRTLQYTRYPNMPCEYCFLTAILIQNNPASIWFTLTHRTTPNMNTVIHPTPYSYIKNSIPSKVHHRVIPPEDIFQPRLQPRLKEQYPYTEDPDFHFQDLYEDAPFTEIKPFPPRPIPMQFPSQYAIPARATPNVVTKIHQTFHPRKFPHRKEVYLTYKHPTFPFFEGIQQPAYGHYPEAYIDTNLTNLAKALPYIKIHRVPIDQVHPLPTRRLQTTMEYQTIITWSFHDHPNTDPNQRLGPTPETFIITFYPALHPPFQYRMYFHPGPQVANLPEYDLPHTTIPVHYISLKPQDTPTLHVLAAIYLTATIPPQCMTYTTARDFEILRPSNIEQLHNEMTYLHAILLDDNYQDSMQYITSPWTLSYNAPTRQILLQNNQCTGDGID